MHKKLFYLLLSACLLYWGSSATAQTAVSFGKYHTPQEVQQLLTKLSGSGNTQLHQIAVSPGGAPITVLEIGTTLNDAPAIFVGANFEGNVPLSTEGALFLAQMLLDSSQYTQNLKWYIMPQPNPDASEDYFAAVKTGAATNFYPINNDADEANGEDGPDDLNGDGLITQMRVKDPEGEYIVSENDPRILKKADTKKGERGIYKLYTEGIDNDKDGKYNEDGVGGINVGIGFPHLFPYKNAEAGHYSGETPEVYGILRFIFDRPAIAMVYTLGTSNFCLVPPKDDRKGGPNLKNIRLSSRLALMLNADVSRTYTLDEVVEMVKQQFPDEDMSPAAVAGILGLGAAVNPQQEDLIFYKQLSDEYKMYLKSKNFSTETLDPTPAKDGSFELWAYYHLGVPSFSMNLFSVPKAKEAKSKKDSLLSMDEVEKMSSEDFIALDKEKIDDFLKTNKAPEEFNSDKVIKMLGGDNFTPKQMVEMLKKASEKEKKSELSEKDKSLLAFSDKELDGKGFVNWTKTDHPALGEVEVGGYAPYIETTPKAELIDSLVKTQIPWLLQLTKQMPQITIDSEKVTDLGAGIYKLEIVVANNGKLPYPTSMGVRNSQPAPLVLTFAGEVELLEGKMRTPIGPIGANQLKKFTWLVKADKSQKITATLESAVFTDVVKQFNIGG
ncbi:MAG: M14 family metallopeptidase [Draconibacterium sp.]